MTSPIVEHLYQEVIDRAWEERATDEPPWEALATFFGRLANLLIGGQVTAEEANLAIEGVKYRRWRYNLVLPTTPRQTG